MGRFWVLITLWWPVRFWCSGMFPMFRKCTESSAHDLSDDVVRLSILSLIEFFHDFPWSLLGGLLGPFFCSNLTSRQFFDDSTDFKLPHTVGEIVPGYVAGFIAFIEYWNGVVKLSETNTTNRTIPELEFHHVINSSKKVILLNVKIQIPEQSFESKSFSIMEFRK